MTIRIDNVDANGGWLLVLVVLRCRTLLLLMLVVDTQQIKLDLVDQWVLWFVLMVETMTCILE